MHTEFWWQSVVRMEDDIRIDLGELNLSQDCSQWRRLLLQWSTLRVTG